MARRRREHEDRSGIWKLIRGVHAPADPSRAVLMVGNADDPQGFEVLIGEALRLPPPAWFTVITTRVGDPGTVSPEIGLTRVGQLSEDACSKLILKSIDDVDDSSDEEAAEVASRTAGLLGRLPLALHVAGSQQRSPVVRHTLAEFGDAL